LAEVLVPGRLFDGNHGSVSAMGCSQFGMDIGRWVAWGDRYGSDGARRTGSKARFLLRIC
jgi:hypothetical protein